MMENSDQQFEQQSYLEVQQQQQIEEQFSIGNEITNATLNLSYIEINLKQFLNGKLTNFISKYIQHLLNSNIERQKFQKYSQILKIKKFYQFQNPELNLYFLPKKILIQATKNNKKNLTLTSIQNILNDNYNKGTINIYVEKLISIYQHCIIFTPSVQNKQMAFQIKLLPQNGNPISDSDRLIQKLLQFYFAICSNNQYTLKYFVGFILYWAYRRGILKPEYITENALKILIIGYLNLNSIPNVIDSYRVKYKDELKQIKKQISLGDQGGWVVNQKLSTYADKYIVELKKGFFMTAKNKHDFMPVIHTVDYPIVQKQFKQMEKNLKQKAKKNISNKSLGQWIYRFFKAIAETLNQGNSIKIDLGYIQGKTKLYEVSQGNDLQNLTIFHPVYRHNLCENLKKKDKFDVVKKQFIRANDLLKQGDLEHIHILCEEYTP